MKNLLLSIILTSACILGYGQVKGPEKGQKVSSTTTFGGPISPQTTSRGQKPQSQLEREMPSKERGQKPQNQSERELPSKEPVSSVKKPSGESSFSNNSFCNGWRDGYIKEWNAKSEEAVIPKVPPCDEDGKLEGYKNGYKAGMKRAQLDKR